MLDLDFAELVFRSSMIEREKADQVKNSMIAASFTAWQIITSNGGKLDWDKHILALGLTDKPPKISDKAKKLMVDKAYYVADKIKASRVNNGC